MFAALCLVPQARADVTLRYTTVAKFGSFLPPQTVDATKRQLSDYLGESSLQIKGQRVRASLGALYAIIDYARGEVTLVDPRSRRFATEALSEFAAHRAAADRILPGTQDVLNRLKFNSRSSKMPSAAVILGTATEEDRVEMTMDVMPGVQLRGETRTWSVALTDLRRQPNLNELADYIARPGYGLDPATALSQGLAAMPAMVDKVRGPAQDRMKPADRLALRMRVASFLPVPSLPGAASADPAVEIMLEFAGLSQAEIGDDRFTVPPGYRSASIEELLRTPPTEISAAAPAPVTAPRFAVPPLPEGVMRVGNGVSAPSIIYRLEPSYSEEARAAKIQGSVLLNVVVRPDGTAGSISVLRSLEPTLDAKAIEAVSRWKFKPGMKDGSAVAVQATIEVSFHLL